MKRVGIGVLATFFRDGHVEGFMNGADFVGICCRGLVGVGGFTGVEDDEVEVGFSGEAGALS